MPRYFFQTQIGADVIDDPVGTELRDPDAAWTVARDTIRDMLAESRDTARLVGACLLVTDAEGEVVLEFPFAEVIAPEVIAPEAIGSLLGTDEPESGTRH